MRLGNRGDTIVLVDPGGATLDQVTYDVKLVSPGSTICFGR